MDEAKQVLVGGRYRILGRLGKGAMGVVFAAHDPVLDRRVAIKQMTAEIAKNDDLRQRFYIEARAAARLNHPHIITIHELQEADGEIYMVMELLEGRSLAALVEEKPGPLGLELTLDLMAQVCDGLDYAHQHLIVHRDIKPANLFITNTGVVKILDFGIARLGSLHMTATGALVGTPDYMSPEQVRGDEIDRRTDLWAAGAVLYQLLSGVKPFEGRPLAKLLTAITQTPHVPLQQRAPALPKTLCDLVDRMLSKPRDRRPATAALVRDELRAILGRDRAALTAVPMSEEYGETLIIRAPGPPAAEKIQEPVVGDAGAADATAVPGVSTAPAAARDVAPPPLPPPLPPAPAQELAKVPTETRANEPAARAVSVPATVGPAAARPPASPVPTPVPPPAAASAPTPQAPKSRVGLLVGGLLAILVLLGGSATAVWLFFGPQLSGLFGGTPATTTASQLPPGNGAAVAPGGSPAPGAGTPALGQPQAPAQPAATEPPVAVDSVPPGQSPAESTDRSISSSPSVPPVESRQPVEAAPARVGGRPPSGAVTPPSAPANAPAPTPAQVPHERPQPAEPIAPPAAPPYQSREAAPVQTRRPTEHLTDDTVSTFSGKRSAPAGGYAAPEGGATVAAVNRINWVLEQYAAALERRDADAVREYRPSLSAAETQLLGAQHVSFKLQNIQVDVDGPTAAARCRRVVDATLAGGKAVKEQGAVTVSLTRRTAGWVITDIR
jgi:eukaryotic-like serine/threonine-protein kinase